MSQFLNYSFYIFFGILPSLVWLHFYLRKDVKPEPKLMILKIFFYGILLTIPAIFIERALIEVDIPFSSHLSATLFSVFLGVALVEEYLKFLVVKIKILNDPEFDEPVDAMIYMIIASLGFAAAENLLVLFSVGVQNSAGTGFLIPLLTPPLVEKIVEVSLLRFLGATFLHALSSGIVGFFIGLSFFEKEKRGGLIFVGLVLAMLLHGLYNFSIMEMEGEPYLITVPFFLLLAAFLFVSFGFKRLKRLAVHYQSDKRQNHFH